MIKFGLKVDEFGVKWSHQLIHHTVQLRKKLRVGSCKGLWDKLQLHRKYWQGQSGRPCLYSSCWQQSCSRYGSPWTPNLSKILPGQPPSLSFQYTLLGLGWTGKLCLHQTQKKRFLRDIPRTVCASSNWGQYNCTQQSMPSFLCSYLQLLGVRVLSHPRVSFWLRWVTGKKIRVQPLAELSQHELWPLLSSHNYKLASYILVLLEVKIDFVPKMRFLLQTPVCFQSIAAQRSEMKERYNYRQYLPTKSKHHIRITEQSLTSTSTPLPTLL